jgi:D-alanyl-D-alanine carboxypeptidase
MKVRIFSTSLLIIALYGAAFSQTLDKAKLDKFLDTLAENNKAMGSLAIAKDGKILYTRTIGYSQINGTEKTPSAVTTKYRIGSITKMFTAVMVMQLVEEGKLKLTDTLDKFYPQIPNASKITIEQMLSHRSGIHSFTSDPDFPTWLMNPKTQSEMLGIIAKGKPDFEPDAKALYSNANFILLGFIVETLDKKPYQTALKDRITSKIGLKDTYVGGKINARNNETFSFNYADGWKAANETDMSIPGGAGALVSTPTDLTKFIHALFDLKLVSQASLDRMKTFKDRYGFGMMPFPLGDKTVIGHGGGIDGFNAMLFYLPEEKLAVAYTSNGKAYPPNNVIIGAMDIYWGKPFTIPTFVTVNVSAEVLDKYVGVYASAEFPLKITVTREGTTLKAQATGQSVFPLDATAQDKFKFDPSGIVVEFDAAKNQMTLRQGGRVTVFTKEK